MTQRGEGGIEGGSKLPHVRNVSAGLGFGREPRRDGEGGSATSFFSSTDIFIPLYQFSFSSSGSRLILHCVQGSKRNPSCKYQLRQRRRQT